VDYPLESLDPERFQRVCQALLLPEFPGARFYPLGQADGGRDALSYRPVAGARHRQLVVFQVKFARDPSSIRDPRKWVLDSLKDEVSKVETLAERGATHYRLITNVRGSGKLDSGSMDKLDTKLGALPIPADAWWRDDLLTRLDVAWSVKWRFPELLTGSDLVRVLVEGALSEERERRTSAIRAFLTEEYDRDRTVKFKQIGLENSLLDLFVDLPLITSSNKGTARDRSAEFALQHVARTSPDGLEADVTADVDDFRYAGRRAVCPVASYLLHDLCAQVVPTMVLEGAPGQGKSTVSQYLCQVHRMRLLQDDQELGKVVEHHRSGPLRLPFRVDLRDLAAWLHGRNPFGEVELRTSDGKRSLESFLAAQVEISSGGAEFTVSDLHAICRVSSVLVALDGLDEVADINERKQVVDEASSGLRRLKALSPSVQAVVTSRPAAFENSPGFSRETFMYFELAALSGKALPAYSEKWIRARGLEARSAAEVRKVIKDKLEQPHMRELARNPMQLAILLTLVHQRGPSLPDKRTALYDSYIALFFDREAEKTPNVAAHRDLLIEIHQYLGWRLQAEAETGNSQGSITDERLRLVLTAYLEREEKDPALVDVLFKSLVERVVAIVSRVQGTYEFEVQPLREYFAARFLYDTAHHSSPGNERPGDKTDRFDALARNFYWLNVTRFFAGCFSRGELLSLVERLQGLAADDGFRHTSHPRTGVDPVGVVTQAAVFEWSV
jgi:hypothetical protein